MPGASLYNLPSLSRRSHLEGHLMSIGYMRVTGKFTRPVTDETGAEREPLAGLRLEFVTNVRPAVLLDSTIDETIPLEMIVGTTDAGGILRGEDDEAGVSLLAADSTTIRPKGWTWTVTVKRADGTAFLRKTFTSTAGTVIDFADLIDVPASPGAELAAWTAAVVAASGARDETFAARDEVRELIEGFEPGEGGGGPGAPGASAYELALANGFVGTEIQWLASLNGEPGDAGQTAYEVAVAGGFVGTESEWLASLKGADAQGDDGASAYDVAVSNGFVGSEAAWLASLVGAPGANAYQVAVANGFAGSQSAWLASLIGAKGDKGDGVVFVYHGANAGTARPATTAKVFWVGTVVPTGMLTDDMYFVTTGEAVPLFTGAFDSFAQPYRVHSLRRTRSAYAGKAIRVRRSSDSTETDIGFTSAGELDTTALLAFAGSGSAYVSTWYDQSGGARDFTQATTAAQPRIVNAGVVDTVSGKPAVIFDGNDDYMTSGAAGLFAATTATVAAVMKSNSNAVSNATVFSESRTANNNGFWRPLRGASANWNVQATDDVGGSLWASTATGSNVFDLAQHQLFYAEGAGVINTWKDNTAVHAALTAARGATTSPVRSGLGAHAGSSVSNFYNGAVQELVAWATNETASRASIQTAQKTYYGTP